MSNFSGSEDSDRLSDVKSKLDRERQHRHKLQQQIRQMQVCVACIRDMILASLLCTVYYA